MKTSLIKIVLLLFCLFSISVSYQQSRELKDIGHKHMHLRRQPEIQTLGKSRSGGGGLGWLGFIVGPLIFICSFILQWNNQRKSAIDFRRLNLAATLVQQQMYNNDGQLIHITGNTQTNDMLSDRISGISLRNAVKLERKVQVRQYRKKPGNNDREDHDEYQLMWVTTNSQNQGGRLNSSQRWFINNQVTKTSQVSIGNYLINDSQIQRLECDQQIVPTLQNAQSIMQQTGHFNQQPQIFDKYIYFPTQVGYREGHGSTRVKFEYCNVGPTSIIAKANKNGFQEFRIDEVDNGGYQDDDNGSMCGCCFLSDCIKSCLSPITAIDLISQKNQSYMEMIDREISDHQCFKWTMRIATYLLMVFGICMFFSPLTNILGYVPLVGGLLKNVVGLAILIAALLICIPLWLLTFSIAWMVFHPKTGILFLGISLVVTAVVIYLVTR